MNTRAVDTKTANSQELDTGGEHSGSGHKDGLFPGVRHRGVNTRAVDTKTANSQELDTGGENSGSGHKDG